MSEGRRLQPRALVAVDRALATMDGAIVLCAALLLAYLAYGCLDSGLVTVSRASFGGGGRALWVAGIALSYACFFLGLAVLHRLASAQLGGREPARRTVLYVAVFPFAYFFTQVYTESLFLLLLSGDPLGWLHAQAHWGYTVGNPPWVELLRLLDGLERSGLYGYFFSDPLAPYYFAHGVVALVAVALVPAIFARLGPALGAYVAVSLYVPLTGNALEGIGRYVATLFPVFMLLGAPPRSEGTRRC